MPQKLKKGSILGFVLLLGILIAAFGFGAFYTADKLNLLPYSNSSTTTGEQFKKSSIMRSVNFKDSKGVKRKFVVIKKTEATGIPVADVYITDDNLTLNTAIKIEELSNDSSLGYAASGINALGSHLTVSVSPGSQNKIILVSIGVGDASIITLISENGEMITKDIVANLLVDLEGKCKCQFVFDSWDKNTSFYLKIRTADAQVYKASISVKDGKLQNGIQKI